MKSIIGKIFILGLILFNISCIQEIELFSDNEKTLVIDGAITSEAGPHNVRVYYTTGFNTRSEFVVGANVSILDDQGNVEELAYTEFGYYQTSETFSAIEGRSYVLDITVTDGKNYRSSPQLVLPVPTIDNVSYKQNGSDIDFHVDFKDDATSDNYYRWRYEPTYQVKAPLAESIDNSFTVSRCDRGYYLPQATAKEKVNCWVTAVDPESLSLTNDVLINGRTLKELKVASVELDRKFDIGYYMHIKLHSMNRDMYNYWEAIDNQLGNSGSIFESANFRIQGNIYNVNDEEEFVLGFFGVSNVSVGGTFVDQFKGSFEPLSCQMNEAGCYPARCLDCRRFATTSSNIKPNYWPR